jgi:hypothetical protein
MKYLKYFETGYYYHDPFHEASKKLRIIFHILGWELSELNQSNSIHLNLDCGKIPYSILHLLLINNENMEDAYPIITQMRKDDLPGDGLVYNFKEIKFVLQNNEPTKLKDIFYENGAPKYYTINGKTQYEIINDFKDKFSLFLSVIKHIGSLTKTYNIGSIKKCDYQGDYRFEFIQKYIMEFIKNPSIIPEFLIKTIYTNINDNPNSYSILNGIKEKQPFIYKQILKLNPKEVNKGDILGKMGFGD